MARTKDYTKYIFCLEGNWYSDLRKPHSVLPLLNYLKETSDIRFVHRHCATVEQLQLYLKIYQQKRYEKFGLCYLAFHGDPGLLYIGKKKIYLEQLVEIAGNAFTNRIVHFSSCKTLDITKKKREELIHQVKAKAIIGYKKDVEFIQGSAVDLLLFEELQQFRDLKSFERQFIKRYGSLTRDQGLVVIHPCR